MSSTINGGVAPWLRDIVLGALAFALVACGPGGGSSTPAPAPPVKYTIGGNVTGLQGTGFVLVNNGADPTPITANGTFTLAIPVVNKSAYVVTVSVQPSGPMQTCTIINGSGTIDGAHVTNLTVNCLTPAMLGTRLGFSKEVKGSDGQLHQELFTVRPDGTDEQQITHDSTTRYLLPCWSRDGRLIAYSKPDFTTTQRDKGSQLFLRDGNGDNERFVDFGYEPSFSDDSTRLIYKRTFQDNIAKLTQDHLYMRELGSGGIEQLSPRGGPAVSGEINIDFIYRAVFAPNDRNIIYFGHIDDSHVTNDPNPVKLRKQIIRMDYLGAYTITTSVLADVDNERNVDLCDGAANIIFGLWVQPQGGIYFGCSSSMGESMFVLYGAGVPKRVGGYGPELQYFASPDGAQVAFSDLSRVLIYNADLNTGALNTANIQFPPINGTNLTLGGWFTP